MCAVDGEVTLYMVLHVNRQEVYAGKRMNETDFDERKYGWVGDE